MSFAGWMAVFGALLIFAVLTRTLAQRLSFTTTMFYLCAGVGLGPYGLGAININMTDEAWFVELLTEIAVVISLFAAGLKLSPPLRDSRWRTPLRLASTSMVITISLIALVGILFLDLSPGAAILLGAVLAPTDPVLASDVQVRNPDDRDRLRFSLTAEAGLNDGTAFPFVLLGLGLLGAHELGEMGSRWLLIDVVWAIVGGLAIGALTGVSVGRVVLYLRTRHREAVGLDEFLALGLISLSYGLAVLADSYGFLAVFASGLALRRIERQLSGEAKSAHVVPVSDAREMESIAVDRDTAPTHMTSSVLHFIEQAEHVGEFIVLLFVGALLRFEFVTLEAVFLIALLLLVIRPVSVMLGLHALSVPVREKFLMGWFGIRGLGAIYYLSYAIQEGLGVEDSQRLTSITLLAVAVSALVHGFSVPALLNRQTRKDYGPPSKTDSTRIEEAGNP